MKKICVTGFIILWVFAQLQAQNIDKLKEKYRESIVKAMKKYNVAGASLVLVHGDQIIWTEGFGFANKANQTKATADTKFMLASVSKVFTATALMKLHEQGKLDIEKPLKKYLPQFNMPSRFKAKGPITPKQVLTHHAGLPSDILRGMLCDSPEDFTQVVHYLNNTQAASAPNLIHSYSNPGYSLLGHTIQQVSGQPYAKALQQTIFKPLKMKNSGIYNGSTYPSNFTQFYNHKGVLGQELPIRDIPAGAIYSTANDLGRFIKVMFNNRLLQQRTRQQIFSYQNKDIALDLDNKQGLCWFLKEDVQLGQIFSHNGGTQHVRTQIAVIPELALGGAILTNSSNGGKVRKVLKRLLKEYAQIKKLNTSKKIKPFGRDFSKYQTIKEDVQTLEKYAGFYANPSIGIFEIKLVNDTLQAHLGNVFGQFIPTQQGDFLVKVPGPGIIPSVRMCFQNVQGHLVFIQTQATGSKELLGNKVSLAPLDQSWKNKAGHYKVINKLPGETLILSNFQIINKGNHLLLQFKENVTGSSQSAALQPTNNRDGYTLGLGRQAGTYFKFTKNAQDEQIFHIYGYQMVKQ